MKRIAFLAFSLSICLFSSLVAAEEKAAGSSVTPDNWSLERDGREGIPLVDFADRKDDARVEAENKAWGEYGKFSRFIGTKDYAGAKGVVDVLLAKYKDTGSAARALKEYAEALSRQPDRKEEAFAAAKLLSDSYPLMRWDANWCLLAVMGRRFDFQPDNCVTFEPGETPKVKVAAVDIKEIEFSVYKVDPEKMLEKGNSLLRPYVEKGMKPLKVWTEKSKSNPNVPGFIPAYDIPVKERGVYLVGMRAGEVRWATLLVVSGISVAAKTDGKILLVYTADRRSGINDDASEVLLAGDGVLFHKSVTSTAGLFAARVSGDLKDRVIVVRRGDDYALCRLPEVGSEDKDFSQIFLMTDRAKYFSSDEISVMAVVRSRNSDGELSFREGAQVKLALQNRYGQVVASGDAVVDGFGCAVGKVIIPERIPGGQCNLVASTPGGNGYVELTVADKIRREYDVNVSFDKKWAVIGDKVKARIAARYYYGRRVANARVRYTVVAAPSFHRLPYFVKEKYSNMTWFARGVNPRSKVYPAEEMLDRGTANFDGKGFFELEIDTSKAGKYINPNRFKRYDLVVKAEVEDANKQEIVGIGEIPLGFGQIQLEQSTDKFGVYRLGETVHLSYSTRDMLGPVSSEVECTLMIRGEKKEYSPVASKKMVTDKYGNGFIEFTPERSGQYRFSAVTRGEGGKEVKRYIHAWVVDPDWRCPHRYLGMNMRVDRDIYQPGDMLTGVVFGKIGDRPVLLTREDSLIRAWSLGDFNGNLRLFNFPIDANYPSFSTVRAVTFAFGSAGDADASFVVPSSSKWLRVKLIPLQDEYMPGEEAVFDISVTDFAGKPVEARVGFALATHNTHRGRPGTKPDIRQFFHGRKVDYVASETSRDFWSAPVERDGENGLGKEMNKDGSSIWVEEDESSLFRSDPNERYRAQSETAAKSVWFGDLKTDGEGKARVSFKMPMHLATWRARAVAIAKNEFVGQATVSVITRQDLVLNLECPDAMVEGDEAVVRAVVGNYSASDKECVVNLELEGIEAKGGTVERRLSVQPGTEGVVTWRLSAPGPGRAKAAVAVASGKSRDQVQIRMNVLPHNMDESVIASGVFDAGGGQKRMSLENVGKSDRVLIEVYPGMMPLLYDSVFALRNSPGEATDKLLYSARALAEVEHVLGGLEIPDIRLAGSGRLVENGVSRILSRQSQGGGWGWLVRSEPDADMTACALYNLIRLDGLKKEVPVESLMKAFKFIAGKIEDENDYEIKTGLLRVYAMVQPPDEKLVAPLYDSREKLSDIALVRLLDVCVYMKNRERSKELFELLVKRAVVENGRAHWGKVGTYATSQAMLAMMRLDRKNELVGQAAAWLIDRRNGAVWEDGRATCEAICALIKYISLYRPADPSMRIGVSFNGNKLGGFTAMGLHVKGVKHTFAAGPELVTGKGDKVVLSGNGRGAIYYSVVHGREGAMAKADHTSKIDREYRLLSKVEKDGQDVFARGDMPQTLAEGDAVEVRLKVESALGMKRVIIRDSLPAGFEVIGNKPVKDSGGILKKAYKEVQSGNGFIDFYVEVLPEGKTEIIYTMRAVEDGVYGVNPPCVFGGGRNLSHSGTGTIVIKVGK